MSWNCCGEARCELRAFTALLTHQHGGSKNDSDPAGDESHTEELVDVVGLEGALEWRQLQRHDSEGRSFESSYAWRMLGLFLCSAECVPHLSHVQREDTESLDGVGEVGGEVDVESRREVGQDLDEDDDDLEGTPQRGHG